MPRDPSRVAFDADELGGGPLRSGRGVRGDRFVPFGGAERRLKSLLIDAKVPRWDRARVPVIEAGGVIIWVGGLRRAAAARVTARTRRVLELATRASGEDRSPAGRVGPPPMNSMLALTALLLATPDAPRRRLRRQQRQAPAARRRPTRAVAAGDGRRVRRGRRPRHAGRGAREHGAEEAAPAGVQEDARSGSANSSATSSTIAISAGGRARTRARPGSGVVVDPKGYILTNNHVIENAQEIIVRLSDQRKFTARLVGRDPKTDSRS